MRIVNGVLPSLNSLIWNCVGTVRCKFGSTGLLCGLYSPTPCSVFWEASCFAVRTNVWSTVHQTIQHGHACLLSNWMLSVCSLAWFRNENLVQSLLFVWAWDVVTRPKRKNYESRGGHFDAKTGESRETWAKFYLAFIFYLAELQFFLFRTRTQRSAVGFYNKWTTLIQAPCFYRAQFPIYGKRSQGNRTQDTFTDVLTLIWPPPELNK